MLVKLHINVLGINFLIRGSISGAFFSSESSKSMKILPNSIESYYSLFSLNISGRHVNTNDGFKGY